MGKRKCVRWEKEQKALQELIALRKRGKTYLEVAEYLNKKFGFNITDESVRHAFNKYGKNQNLTEDVSEEVNDDLIEYKGTHEILKDGSHVSDRLILMSREEEKDPEYLLRAHGFDPNKWKLISARNNFWHVYSVEDGQKISYASRITVKPLEEEFSYEDFIEHIKQSKPIQLKLKRQKIDDKRLLEISTYDMHFPISDYNYYKPTQNRIYNKITSRHWEEIVFSIGSDLFHNDDFRGRTASGREIQHVDMEKAWDDARVFYEPLIREATKNSNRVKIIFIKGNHDESMSWAFVQMLKARFPQLDFDDSFQERKIHTFHSVFIGFTHGDKNKKNLHNIFPAEFPKQWAKAKTKEIHVGHLHREDAIDHFGTVVRTLSTRNRTDQWHLDNGYIGSIKRFQLFEYSKTDLESIHYV